MWVSSRGCVVLMRLKLVFKNSIWSILSYLSTGIIALLVRKLFIVYLPVELLGYEGLFGDLFAIMSLANLGLDTIIAYRLYPAFAHKDESAICKLMNIYKTIYRIVGSIILLISSMLVPFLHFIIKNNELNWGYIYLVYFIQLITILCTYFLGYKRILFLVEQKNYECIKVDTIFSVLSNVLRILVIVLFKSYILYLIVNVVMTLSANIVISKKFEIEYAYATKKVKISIQDVKEEGLYSDIKNNIVQKIGLTIYSSTDNIIISSFLSIGTVALVSNYNLLAKCINTALEAVVGALQPYIGNTMYSDSKEHGIEIFNILNYLSHIVACIVADSFFILLNPVITIWIGKEKLLPVIFSLAFALNQYIGWNQRILTLYRNVIGKYEVDKNYILIGAILNVGISLILVKPLGVAGIIIGTVIGHLGFWIGRIKVVFGEYIQSDLKHYLLNQIKYFISWGCEIVILYFICANMDISIRGIIFRVLVCMFVSILMNYAINFKSSEQTSLIKFIKTYLKNSTKGSN